MKIQEHPNVREYLTRFLLHVQKHAIVEETREFEVEVREEPLSPDTAEMLQ